METLYIQMPVAAIFAICLASTTTFAGENAVFLKAAASDLFDKCLNSGDARQGVMPAMFDCFRMVIYMRLWFVKSTVLAITEIYMVDLSAYSRNNVTYSNDLQKTLLDKCIDNSENAVDLLGCWEPRLHERDIILNKNYKSLQNTLSVYDRNRLRAIERKWIMRRDRKFEQDLGQHPGRYESLLYFMCMNAETDERIDWINRYAANR